MWSRAEQVLTVAPAEGASGVYKLSLSEAASGKPIRSVAFAKTADETAVRRSVCDVLGETCELPRGIPWYVWPLAGAVLVGGVVTTTVVLENNRDTRFCPPSGCR